MAQTTLQLRADRLRMPDLRVRSAAVLLLARGDRLFVDQSRNPIDHAVFLQLLNK